MPRNTRNYILIPLFGLICLCLIGYLFNGKEFFTLFRDSGTLLVAIIFLSILIGLSYAFFKEHNPALDSQINLKSKEEDNKLTAGQFKKLYLMLGAVSVNIIMLFICILCQSKLPQYLADQISKILTFLLPLILSLYSGYMLINFIFYKKPLPSPIVPSTSKEQTNLYIQVIDVVAYLVAFGFSVFFTCMLFGYFWLNL